MQNLPFFVGEWALERNRPLLPVSRAKVMKIFQNKIYVYTSKKHTQAQRYIRDLNQIR